MIRNRILLKSFAVFFLFEILLNTLAPAVSWALTAGPTAPEYSSFEPVDTTNMVDIISGDFVYNTPLLEVPGPCGGYPLSLYANKHKLSFDEKDDFLKILNYYEILTNNLK